MACNLKRIADLPVQEEYKLRLIEFFQKPENAAACEKLNQVPDEQLVAIIQNIGQKLAQQGGQPPAQQPAPGPTGPAPGAGGIASMQQPMRPQTPPGVPPGQLGAVPKPMDIPVGGIARIPPRR